MICTNCHLRRRFRNAVSFTTNRIVDSDYRVLSVCIAALLLASAVLKVFHHAGSAGTLVGADLPYWITVAAVQTELLVGISLLFGFWPWSSWAVTVGLFIVFAAFSLQRTLAHYTSCGCFGSIKVHPWWTLVIDVGIVSLLVVRRRSFIHQSRSLPRTTMLFVALIGYLALGGVAQLFMVRGTLASVRDGVAIEGGGNVIILDPSKWKGQELPIHDAISPTTADSRGEVIVLLYHHDCPRCQEALRAMSGWPKSR